MKYSIDFMGYYNYIVKVEADNEEQAVAKAKDIFKNVDANEFIFISDGHIVTEEKK